MNNVHTLPDQRIPKAIEKITQILCEIDPPIHTATALGILELCKSHLMAHQAERIFGDES